MFDHQLAHAEHHLGPFDHRRFGPFGQGGRGGLHGGVDFVGTAQRHLGDNFASRRVENFAPAAGLGRFPLAADQQLDVGDLGGGFFRFGSGHD